MNLILIDVVGMIGVIAAAISGVLTAAQVSLDVFGTIVLGCVTAVGGGIIRDLLLGITPPASFRDPTPVIVAIIVSLAVFLLEYFFSAKAEYSKKRYEQLLNAFDSLGLASFVIIGVDATGNAGFAVNLFLKIFVGLVTGVGGGILRDMMIGKIPVILQKRIYALAALLGAVLYVYLPRMHCPKDIAMYISIASVLVIRFLATYYKWNMPRYPREK